MALPDLPPELSDRILDHLYDDKPTLSLCSLVCRAWRDTAHFHLFRDVVLEREHGENQELLRHVIPRCTRTQSLELCDWDIAEAQDLELVHQIPSLTHLILTRCAIGEFRRGKNGERKVFRVRKLTLNGIVTWPGAPLFYGKIAMMYSKIFKFFPDIRILHVEDTGTKACHFFPVPKEMALEEITLHHCYHSGGDFLKELFPTSTTTDLTLKRLDVCVSTDTDGSTLSRLHRHPHDLIRGLQSLRIESDMGKSTCLLLCQWCVPHAFRIGSLYTVTPFWEPLLLPLTSLEHFTMCAVILKDQMDICAQLFFEEFAPDYLSMSTRTVTLELRIVDISCPDPIEFFDSAGGTNGPKATEVMKGLETSLLRLRLEYFRVVLREFDDTESLEPHVQQRVRELMPTLSAKGLLRFVCK